MAFISFDPRKAIRDVICSTNDPYGTGTNIYGITVTDSDSYDHFIPLYMTEDTKSDDLPPLPLIEFGLLHETASPLDIAASTRKHEAIIDVHIYWQEMDEIDESDFGKQISDELCDLIRTNQCGTVSGTHFINVRNTGYLLRETRANQVVYHRILEVYVLWYDRP